MKIINKGSVAQAIRKVGGSYTIKPGQAIDVEENSLKINLKDKNLVQHYANNGVYFEGFKPEVDPSKEHERRIKIRKERDEETRAHNEKVREGEAAEAEKKRKEDEKLAKDAKDEEQSDAKKVDASVSPGRGGNASARA